MQQALPVTDGELALVHTPHYIDAVARGGLSPAEQREIGFPWSAAMAERARRSVGATVQACRAALSGQGVAANLAGGMLRRRSVSWCPAALAPLQPVQPELFLHLWHPLV